MFFAVRAVAVAPVAGVELPTGLGGSAPVVDLTL